MNIWRKRITYSLNYEAVSRTAPATLGLLKTREFTPFWRLFEIFNFSGQLKYYRFLRILRTLDENFPSFQPALVEFVFDKAKKETSSLKQQPQPSNITMTDLDNFSYCDYYGELMSDAPVLHAAVTGSMGTHFNYSEIEVGRFTGKETYRGNIIDSCMNIWGKYNGIWGNYNGIWSPVQTLRSRVRLLSRV